MLDKQKILENIEVITDLAQRILDEVTILVAEIQEEE